MSINEFIDELKKINIVIDDKKLEQLEEYYNLVIEKNKVMNLTGITNKNEFYLKHFYDSLTISKIIDLNEITNLCDIGSGAGFPGVVLKIAYPQLDVTLVDSLEKRTKFLNYLIKELNLENIKVETARIEDYSKKHKEEFDIITSRAVASLPIILELASQLVKIKGYFIILKAKVEGELLQSENALKTLNFKLEKMYQFKLPVEESTRTILKIRKTSKVSELYPRDFAKIKHRPL